YAVCSWGHPVGLWHVTDQAKVCVRIHHAGDFMPIHEHFHAAADFNGVRRCVNHRQPPLAAFLAARFIARSIAFSYSLTKVLVTALILSARALRMNGCARMFSVPNSSRRQCGVGPLRPLSGLPFSLITAPCITPMRKPRSPVRLNSRPFQRRPMLAAMDLPVSGSSIRAAPSFALLATSCAALRKAERPPLRFTSYVTASSLPSRLSRPVMLNSIVSAIARHPICFDAPRAGLAMEAYDLRAFRQPAVALTARGLLLGADVHLVADHVAGV